jgi:hypothetical protein
VPGPRLEQLLQCCRAERQGVKLPVLNSRSSAGHHVRYLFVVSSLKRRLLYATRIPACRHVRVQYLPPCGVPMVPASQCTSMANERVMCMYWLASQAVGGT